MKTKIPIGKERVMLRKTPLIALAVLLAGAAMGCEQPAEPEGTIRETAEGPFMTVVAPAVGDLLQSVNVPAAASCGIGTSVALVPGSLVGFPGTPVLLVISCFFGNQLFYLDPATNPATLVKTVTTIGQPAGGWGSLAFRADKNDLSGCGNVGATHPIFTIDPNTGATTFQFNTVGGNIICDGHSWDATDQTYFVSPDVSNTIFHFSEFGTALGSFPAAPGCPNSGVAVGGSILYEACDGVLTIFRVNKGDGSLVGSFPSAGSRTEDLECDPISFAGLGVDGMWSKDAFTNQIFAFEIPLGECGFGGQPPEIDRLDKFFDPEKDEPGQGPDPIVIGQQTTTQYSFAIDYVKSDPNTPQARLVETVPAEFDVVSATADDGTLNVFRTGQGPKSQSSTKITVDLAAGPQSVRIDVVITTRALPNGKRFKPTSCGVVPLNSGPVFVFEVDPETGAIRLDEEGNKVVLAGPSDILDIVAVEDPDNADNDGDCS